MGKKYKLYPSMIDEDKRLIKKKFGKGADYAAIIREFIGSGAMNLNSIEMDIRENEYFWMNSGCNVIFPESSAVIDNLIRAKYDVTKFERIKFPFDAYVVAMPTDYICPETNVHMPSLLVTVSDGHSKAKALHKYYGLDVVYDGNANHDLVTILYRNPIDGTHARIGVKQSDLHKYLSCKSWKELGNNIHKTTALNAIDPDDLDLIIQFYSLKVISSIAVYNLATEGERLIPGFPGGVKPALESYSKEQRESNNLRFSTLKNTSKAKERESHYRAWHMRQLRADRYYQGEYSAMEKGSRYVFVSDSVVGQKVDPTTMVS